MPSKHFAKTIGIIGGAGPMASAFLYSEILRLSQKLYGAQDYNEFPEIILISYPFTRGRQEKIEQELTSCFDRLSQAGADISCLVSHSLHSFLPADKLPQGFVNLIDLSLTEAKEQQITKSLILASPSTIATRLYEKSSLDCVYPSDADQETVNTLICQVASGHIDQQQAQTLQSIIENTPCDGVIIACTELPLIPPFTSKVPVVNTAQLLAKTLLTRAQGT